jgi:hypothetical protein
MKASGHGGGQPVMALRGGRAKRRSPSSIRVSHVIVSNVAYRSQQEGDVDMRRRVGRPKGRTDAGQNGRPRLTVVSASAATKMSD